MKLPVYIDCRPCAPNHLYHFQKWLRRPLSSLERSVIEPIERQRAANRGRDLPTRIFVDDPGTFGTAIRDILILYLRWYSTLVAPRFQSCIIGRYRNEASQAIRTSFLNNDLKINLQLLNEARLTPERLASYKTAGWMRRLAPNIFSASAKFIDHIRGRSFNTALVLDADTFGHSSRRSYYGVRHFFRVRYQSYERVHSTLAGILPSAADSLTIIHGNPTPHPRYVYARLRRNAIEPTSEVFHVITPTATPEVIVPAESVTPTHRGGGFSRQAATDQYQSLQQSDLNSDHSTLNSPPLLQLKIS